MFLLISANMTVYAVPAAPYARSAEQADGTIIIIRVFGDERFSWYEDKDNYVIAYDEESRNWCYAFIDGNRIVPGPQIVGKTMLIGDINGDGVVDIKDLLLLIKYTAEKIHKIHLTSEQLKYADVNDDGVIDANDAIKLARCLAKIPGEEIAVKEIEYTGRIKSDALLPLIAVVKAADTTKITPDSATLTVGETKYLIVHEPFGVHSLGTQPVKWNTDDTEIATVNSISYTSCEVTAIAPGDAIITATNSWGTVIDTCVVTVIPDPAVISDPNEVVPGDTSPGGDTTGDSVTATPDPTVIPDPNDSVPGDSD